MGRKCGRIGTDSNSDRDDAIDGGVVKRTGWGRECGGLALCKRGDESVGAVNHWGWQQSGEARLIVCPAHSSFSCPIQSPPWTDAKQARSMRQGYASQKEARSSEAKINTNKLDDDQAVSRAHANANPSPKLQQPCLHCNVIDQTESTGHTIEHPNPSLN